jgi:hypothetical protein
MLAAVELDHQVPLATNEVDIEPTDRFLADKFDAAELPAANACPQREFRLREGASQRSRPLDARLVPSRNFWLRGNFWTCDRERCIYRD